MTSATPVAPVSRVAATATARVRGINPIRTCGEPPAWHSRKTPALAETIHKALEFNKLQEAYSGKVSLGGD